MTRSRDGQIWLCYSTFRLSILEYSVATAGIQNLIAELSYPKRSGLWAKGRLCRWLGPCVTLTGKIGNLVLYLTVDPHNYHSLSPRGAVEF